MAARPPKKRTAHAAGGPRRVRRARARRVETWRERRGRGAGDQPQVGVGAVLVHAGKVLLIRRGKQPLRGRWMVPGGTVELGESLEQALVREIHEETGLVVRPREPVAVVDRIQRENGRVRSHYVIVDFLCEYVSGSAQAGSDAQELAFASPEELSSYKLPRAALAVVLEGLRRVSVPAAPPVKHNGLPPAADAGRIFKSILADRE